MAPRMNHMNKNLARMRDPVQIRLTVQINIEAYIMPSPLTALTISLFTVTNNNPVPMFKMKNMRITHIPMQLLISAIITPFSLVMLILREKLRTAQFFLPPNFLSAKPNRDNIKVSDQGGSKTRPNSAQCLLTQQ
jgi:hypothetical protein